MNSYIFNPRNRHNHAHSTDRSYFGLSTITKEESQIIRSNRAIRLHFQNKKHKSKDCFICSVEKRIEITDF